MNSVVGLRRAEGKSGERTCFCAKIKQNKKRARSCVGSRSHKVVNCAALILSKKKKEKKSENGRKKDKLNRRT